MGYLVATVLRRHLHPGSLPGGEEAALAPGVFILACRIVRPVRTLHFRHGSVLNWQPVEDALVRRLGFFRAGFWIDRRTTTIRTNMRPGSYSRDVINDTH